MLRHAAHAVPWGLMTLTSVLVVILMEAVRREPWTLWPLQGVAVGLLAGAVGWCLDEPAAAVVDPAPRGLAWRTAARSLGIVVLLGAWALAVWLARASLFGEALAVLVQGVVAMAVALSWVTWRRARGEATPGNRWALAVIPLVTAWALVRPFDASLPVFPFADGGPYGSWGASLLAWTLVGVLALLGLVASLVEGLRFGRTSPDPHASRSGRPAAAS